MEKFNEIEEKLIADIRRLKETEVDLNFIAGLRYRILLMIDRDAATRRFAILPNLRFAGVVASILIAILSTGGAATLAAQKSLPSDFLYPLKLASERAKIAFTPSGLEKAGLRVNFAERRLEEIQKASSGPKVIVQNLERLEKELLEAHSDINYSRAKESGGVLVASISRVEEKIFRVGEALNEFKIDIESRGERSPEVDAAITRAQETANVGLDRVTDAIFKAMEKDKIDIDGSGQKRIQRKLEKIDRKITSLRLVIGESQLSRAGSVSPFIAPENDLALDSREPAAQKLITVQDLLKRTQRLLDTGPKDILAVIKNIQEIEGMIEEIEAEIGDF